MTTTFFTQKELFEAAQAAKEAVQKAMPRIEARAQEDSDNFPKVSFNDLRKLGIAEVFTETFWRFLGISPDSMPVPPDFFLKDN